ncbi:MAG: ribosome maturation factor RimM [Actinomycetota bacterium]|nr:ribosome maturation factor RimM [Actinomycetota bacterium]
MGRIVKPHGVHGEMLVEPYSESRDRFSSGKSLWVGDPDRNPRRCGIAGCRPSRDWFIITLQGVDDREGAEALRGALLSIPAAEARPLTDGRYYPHDIEGCDVVDESGAILGTLVGVLENAANDLWVVRSGDRDVLVPAVKELIVSVDVGARRIVVNPIPGLFED